MKLKFLSLLIGCFTSVMASADAVYQCGPYELSVGAYAFHFSLSSDFLGLQCDNLRFTAGPGYGPSRLDGVCLREGKSESAAVSITDGLYLGAYGNDAGEIYVSLAGQKANKYTCGYLKQSNQ